MKAVIAVLVFVVMFVVLRKKRRRPALATHIRLEVGRPAPQREVFHG